MGLQENMVRPVLFVLRRRWSLWALAHEREQPAIVQEQTEAHRRSTLMIMEFCVGNVCSKLDCYIIRGVAIIYCIRVWKFHNVSGWTMLVLFLTRIGGTFDLQELSSWWWIQSRPSESANHKFMARQKWWLSYRQPPASHYSWGTPTSAGDGDHNDDTREWQ